MKNEIFPWGVNVPYLIIAGIYFLAGGLSLFTGQSHGLLMLLGAYSLYSGMIQRLFFPARKYIVPQLINMILVCIPIPLAQVLAYIALTITAVWSVLDVSKYGAKYPINLLVLSSPILSVIFWTLFSAFGNYWLLIIPLMSYLFGVNVGVFTATLGVKPKYGLLQLPILAAVFSILLIHYVIVPVGIYFAWLFFNGVKRFNLSAAVTVFTGGFTSLLSVFTGMEIHAFALGVMLPFFYSCITYSLSRYNYDYEYVIPLLLMISYFIRMFLLIPSGIATAVGIILFYYLNIDNFSLFTLRNGLSKKFLSGNA
ncbi:hypothetical protein HS7_12590 [Sulfolobales archaeon HS-7]|nr:hypothetical protein HS7_12590 [Sulfolobales archaeon HS-7]